MPARLKRWYWPLAALLLIVHATLAFGWIPGALRAAHAGNGSLWFRRAMEGTAQHPLQGYLDRWDGLARVQLFWLATVLLIGWLLLRLWEARRVRAGRAEPETDPPVLAPVLIGVWFGLLSGIGEAYYVAMRTGFLRKMVPRYNEANLDTALLAPIANALIFGGLGALIVLLGRRRGRAWAARFAVASFAGLTAAGWTLVGGSVAVFAGVILAAGVAAQAWRLAGPDVGRFAAWTGPAALRALALVAGLAVLNLIVPRIQPARLNRSLPESPSRMNVIWIVLDTERAKSLELHGRGRPTSPGLTRFAGDAIVFDHAIAPCSWTLPSHGSYFTGVPAAELGVWTWTALPGSRGTVAEVLRDNGYRTAGFAGNVWALNPSFGLAQGFTEWSATPVGWQALRASTWLGRMLHSGYRKLRHRPDYLVEYDAARINRAAERWIARQTGDRPFFLFINYFDVHEPFDPRPGCLPAPLPAGVPDWLANGIRAADYRPEHVKGLLDAYESEIGWLDAEVERLLSAIRARGLLDSTLVIITSDHGEQFGEHGLLDHGNSLFRPLLHVPLVVRLPGGARAGTRIAEPVATQNIAATLLDVVGIEAGGFPGTSLAPLWRGEPTPSAPIVSSQEGWLSVVAEGYHLIVPGNGRAELYRLDDSEEARNLADSPEHQDLVLRLRSLLPGDPP